MSIASSGSWIGELSDPDTEVMKPFSLRDDDVLLDLPTDGDVATLTDLCQDPEIQRFTLVPSPYYREHAEGFVTEHVPNSWEAGSPVWAIRARRAEQWHLTGVIELGDVGNGSAQIGYWLGALWRGLGLLPRAMSLALTCAFEDLGLQRIEWRALAGNWASWRVAWRQGFRLEGSVRGSGVQRGERVDEWIATLLREDPRQPAQPWNGPEAQPEAVCMPAQGLGAVPGGGSSFGSEPDSMVREFHEAFAIPVREGGTAFDPARTRLRMTLVAEEFSELVTAVYGRGAGAVVEESWPVASAHNEQHHDAVATADALGDLVYVLYGMALELGIPLPEVLAEIHRANLSKLDANGRPLLREDGKVLKSASYRPPELRAVLDRHTAGATPDRRDTSDHDEYRVDPDQRPWQ